MMGYSATVRRSTTLSGARSPPQHRGQRSMIGRSSSLDHYASRASVVSTAVFFVAKQS
jgi:hypothetical protein